MLAQGCTKTFIADTIGKHKSVVSCKVKLNSDLHSDNYNSNLAQRKQEERLFEKPKQIKFTSTIKATVRELLVQDYSQKQVVGTLKKENKPYVSAERIYQYIWQDKKTKRLIR
jgi:IS30 family transposase